MKKKLVSLIVLLFSCMMLFSLSAAASEEIEETQDSECTEASANIHFPSDDYAVPLYFWPFADSSEGIITMEIYEGFESDESMVFPECSYSRPGYEFCYWTILDTDYVFRAGDHISIPEDEYLGDQAVLFYAYWEAINYPVTYVLNGGTNSEKNPEYCNIEEEPEGYTLYDPTRTGYTFTGWYTDSKLTKKVEVIGLNYEAETVYAGWTRDIYSITYVLNKGTNNISNPVQYSIASATKTLQAPERTGFTFGGWYTDSKLTKPITEIKKGSVGNLTLYAKWTANTYTIKFSGNGADAGSTASIKATYGQYSTLSTNGFTRTCYTFAGWNTKADGSGTSYAAGASVKNLTTAASGKVVLYAQWKANKYKVAFYANGGTGTMDTVTYSMMQTYTLPKNTFKYSGASFAGWNTKANGSGTSYENLGSVMNLTTTKSATVKLYAQWTPSTNVKLSISKVSFTKTKLNFNCRTSSGKDFTGAEKYVIYRAASADGPFTKLAVVTADTYTDTSVEAGVTYFYKVTCIYNTIRVDSAVKEFRTAMKPSFMGWPQDHSSVWVASNRINLFLMNTGSLPLVLPMAEAKSKIVINPLSLTAGSSWHWIDHGTGSFSIAAGGNASLECRSASYFNFGSDMSISFRAKYDDCWYTLTCKKDGTTIIQE